MLFSHIKFTIFAALFLVAGTAAFGQSESTQMVEGRILMSDNQPIADGIYRITTTVPGTTMEISTEVETFDGLFMTVIAFPSSADVALTGWNVATVSGEEMLSDVHVAPIMASESEELTVSNYESLVYQYSLSGVGTPVEALSIGAGADEGTEVPVVPTVQPQTGAFSHHSSVTTNSSAN